MRMAESNKLNKKLTGSPEAFEQTETNSQAQFTYETP